MRGLLRLLLIVSLLQISILSQLRAQIADFSITPTSGCAPLLVNFTDQSTGGPFTAWNWNFGNSTTSTVQNGSTTYSVPGVYTISLTVTGPGGTSAPKTAQITVYDKPSISFSAVDSDGCAPHTTQFRSIVTPNSPGNVGYAWDFGDGTADTGASPFHTYANPGTYPVSLTVTNGAGCPRTVLKSGYITVYENPVGDFSVSIASFCAVPATTTFTNTSHNGTPPYTANWTFGDGGTGSGNTIAHSYATGGVFTVTITVKDANGCQHIQPNLAVTVTTTQASFSSRPAICHGELAQFLNTTPGGGDTHWDFGDGVTSFGDSTAHQYANPGIDTVTMTTTVNGCVRVLKKTIQVNPRPDVSMGLYPPYPCPAPSSIRFTGHSSIGGSYVYKDFKDSIIATTDTFTKYYYKNQSDAVKLVVTTAAGCKDSIRTDTIQVRGIYVDIFPEPPIPYFYLPFCLPGSEAFYVVLKSTLNLSVYPLPALTWAWDFGDHTVDSSSNPPTHHFPNLGFDTVRCIITSANGCTDTGYRLIHNDVKVHPSFYASPLVICPQDTVTFYNTTYTTIPFVRYDWFMIETGFYEIYDTLPIKYAFQVADTTKDILLITTNHGCADTANRKAYITVHPPGANFTDSIYCPPSRTVTFTNKSIKATSQVWDFGDGTTDTAFNVPPHNYAHAGTYGVKLDAYNSTFNCHDVVSKTITVFDRNLDFKTSDSTLCTGQIAGFEPVFAGNGTALYKWIFDTTQTPFLDTNHKAISQLYLDKGFHDVTLIVSFGTGCFDTIRKHNHILVSRPAVDFIATPMVGCLPLNVTFSDRSTNAPTVPTIWRRWIYTRSDTSYHDTIYHAPHDTSYTFYSRDNYNIFLTVEDSLGCFDSLTKMGFVSARKPTAIFTTDKLLVCTKSPVVLKSISTGVGPLSYKWDFGDGTPAGTNKQETHRFQASGTYAVRLIVSDTVGCHDTMIRTIIADAPIAGYTMSDSTAICPSVGIQFTDTSHKAVAWLWNFGASGGSANIPNPFRTFVNSGQYNVYQVAIDANGCTDTARSTVRVLGYNGAFTYAPLQGCAPMLVNFSSLVGGIPKITWDFSDGNTTVTNGTPAMHFYLNPGPYLPRVIFSDGKSCAAASIGLDTIWVDKVSATFDWSVPCVGTAFNLTETSSGKYKDPDSWTWIFGAGDTATGPSPSHTYSTTGGHTITLIALNSTGCADTVIKQVYVHPLPIVVASPDKGLCPDDSTKLWATGASNYVWSPISLVSCVNCDSTIVHILPTPTYYYVNGTDTNGCVNKDSVLVYIQLKTTDTTGPGGEICVGESFRLFAGGADNYLWLPEGRVDNPHIASPLATPSRTTTYLLIAQEGTCKVDSVYVSVTVHSLPIFSAGYDETIARGGAVTLHPTQQGITRIEWRTDSTLSCLDCFLPIAHPYHTRTYYATGYNEYGCSVTDSVTVFVRCNGDLVFVPNTFSPNGDGNNDFFFPRGEGVDLMSTFRIFNRWGQMVYERSNIALNDERAGWDGTFNGKALAPDVYVYTMQSQCEDGKMIRWKGDVTLMK